MRQIIVALTAILLMTGNIWAQRSCSSCFQPVPNNGGVRGGLYIDLLGNLEATDIYCGRNCYLQSGRKPNDDRIRAAHRERNATDATRLEEMIIGVWVDVQNPDNRYEFLSNGRYIRHFRSRRDNELTAIRRHYAIRQGRIVIDPSDFDPLYTESIFDFDRNRNLIIDSFGRQFEKEN